MRKQNFGPNSKVLGLSEEWSGRARRLIASIPYGSSILNLYRWHWSGLGKNKYRGFQHTPDFIGLRTYEEIRLRLIRSGFPDLSDKMFSPSGFCSKCCPKSLLKKVLAKWKSASKKERSALRKSIYDCDCDGH